jgi:hypothetical protein
VGVGVRVGIGRGEEQGQRGGGTRLHVRHAHVTAQGGARVRQGGLMRREGRGVRGVG